MSPPSEYVSYRFHASSDSPGPVLAPVAVPGRPRLRSSCARRCSRATARASNRPSGRMPRTAAGGAAAASGATTGGAVTGVAIDRRCLSAARCCSYSIQSSIGTIETSDSRRRLACNSDTGGGQLPSLQLLHSLLIDGQHGKTCRRMQHVTMVADTVRKCDAVSCCGSAE